MKSNRKRLAKARNYSGAIASIAAGALLFSAAPAQAHVSIYPSPNGTGSSTAPLVKGASFYLNFRIGHGCEDETTTLSKLDGSALKGSLVDTSSVSIVVPLKATNNGATVPKQQNVPGWTVSTVKNSDGTYKFTWSANDASFAVPADAAAADDLDSSTFAEFGIYGKWTADATGDVYFPSTQVCKQDISGIPATKSAHKVAITKVGSRSVVTFKGPKSMAGQVLNFKIDGVTVDIVTLDKKGNAKIKANKANSKLIQAKGSLIAFTDSTGVVKGWKGGKAATRDLVIEWNKDVSGATATYSSDMTIEYNQAPKVTVTAS